MTNPPHLKAGETVRNQVKNLSQNPWFEFCRGHYTEAQPGWKVRQGGDPDGIAPLPFFVRNPPGSSRALSLRAGRERSVTLPVPAPDWNLAQGSAEGGHGAAGPRSEGVPRRTGRWQELCIRAAVGGRARVHASDPARPGGCRIILLGGTVADPDHAE